MDLIVTKCKRCNKDITTSLPIISKMQCICADCTTKKERFDILNEQAKLKGLEVKQ